MSSAGSDRIPVGGLAKLKLIIAKNGPDSDRLLANTQRKKYNNRFGTNRMLTWPPNQAALCPHLLQRAAAARVLYQGQDG